MPLAYSFDGGPAFKDAVKMFEAVEDWVRKPNLDGRWLVRDNDRLGDYLSYYAFDETDGSIVKTICIFFDTCPRQVTLAVSRDKKVQRGGGRGGDIEQVWREHKSYVLEVLLPLMGARNLKPSDFEK